MHRLCLITLAVLLILALPVAQAQEGPSYRLRAPTAAEYLAAVPGAIQQWWEDIPFTYGKTPNQPLNRAIATEINLRYPDTVLFTAPFSTLDAAYNAIQYTGSPYDVGTVLDGYRWLTGMLLVWLRENQADFSQDENLTLPNFAVLVEAIDFNGDGEDEFWLTLQSWTERGYIILRRDSDLPEGYRIAATPAWMWMDMYDSDACSMDMVDLTADGAPEWLISFGYVFGIGTWVQSGRVSVFTWRNGTLVDVLPQDNTWDEGAGGGLCAQSLTPEYLNLDDDAPLELQLHEREYDNWDCRWITTRTFDWDGENFILSDRHVTTEDSLGCAMRRAEPLMWEGEYTAAADRYEHGLEVGWEEEQEINVEIAQYARARLALAYALVGRDRDTDRLIESLGEETPASGIMEALITALGEAQPTALARCIAAYNVFDEYASSAFTNRELPTSLRMGRIEPIRGMTDDRPPAPERAGCDAPGLIDSLLTGHTFTQESPPTEQVQALGLDVDTAVSADLNADGAQDWLVWLTARVDPILFVTQGDEYGLSRPTVRRPNEYTRVFAQALPGGAGEALVDWVYGPSGDFRQASYYDVPSVVCITPEGEYSGYSSGSIRLWRLNGDSLESMLEAPLCERREPADIFQNEGRELHAWAVAFAPEHTWVNRYGEAIYHWDAERGSYVPPDPAPLIEPTIIPDVLPTDRLLIEIATQAQNLIGNGNYAGALVILDEAITHHDSSASAALLNGLRYLRALALEQLNRPDEALAEYVAVYEAVPESAWGMLAALHLEIAE